jgi:hypothetical protein
MTALFQRLAWLETAGDEVVDFEALASAQADRVAPRRLDNEALVGIWFNRNKEETRSGRSGIILLRHPGLRAERCAGRSNPQAQRCA